MRRLRQLALVLLMGLLPAGTAFGDDETGEPGKVLRVGTSGDYPPFSVEISANPGTFEGFDVALARSYAEERGIAIEFVRFRWHELLDDLASGRFDVAMSGITVRPERSAQGRFSVPVGESGAVALVREPDRWPDIDSLDNRLARIGVNAGGHLEQVARKRFPYATLIAIPDNAQVLRSLADEQIDAAVSDTAEVSLWSSQLEGSAVFGPFTRDRKAFLTRPESPDLASDLDAWLLAREADGQLEALRSEYSSVAAPKIGGVLGALLAAVDERLSLMPLVGVAKRDQGIPLEVPEREKIVLATAVAEVRATAERDGVEPPTDDAIRAFFRAQMDAAKAVQWAAVQDSDYDPPAPHPSVQDVLRPALLRIGGRIATLSVALPAEQTSQQVLAAARRELRSPYLSRASVDSLARAIAALRADTKDAQPRDTSRARPPARIGSSRQTP
jgi:cyclohexadienyl dehydratase